MLKVIALAGIFVFTSAVSMAAVTSAPRKDVSAKSIPAAPQPHGFCFPAGSHC